MCPETNVQIIHGKFTDLQISFLRTIFRKKFFLDKLPQEGDSEPQRPVHSFVSC